MVANSAILLLLCPGIVALVKIVNYIYCDVSANVSCGYFEASIALLFLLLATFVAGTTYNIACKGSLSEVRQTPCRALRHDLAPLYVLKVYEARRGRRDTTPVPQLHVVQVASLWRQSKLWNSGCSLLNNSWWRLNQRCRVFDMNMSLVVATVSSCWGGWGRDMESLFFARNDQRVLVVSTVRVVPSEI